MAELKAKFGESRMDMIRRAQPGDTLIFGNECLERKHHCFDGSVGHSCFTCCYCSLINGNDYQFQDQVAEDFKKVYGDKFAIIPKIIVRRIDKSIEKQILKDERERIKDWVEKNRVYNKVSDYIYAQDFIEFLSQ